MKKMMMLMMLFLLLGCREEQHYIKITNDYIILDGIITDEVRLRREEIFLNDKLMDSKVYMGNDYLHEHCVYEYDTNKEILTTTSNGQSYEVEKIYQDGKIIAESSKKNGQQIYSLSFEYDDQHKYTFLQPNKELIRKESEVENGIKIEDYALNTSGYVIRFFHEQLLTEEQFFDEDNHMISQVSYDYDEYDNKILEVYYDPKEEKPVMQYETVFTYNKEGLPVNITEYHDDLIYRYLEVTYKEIE